MKRTPLDIHEDMPTHMKKYINNYGWHFNKQAYEYATKLMFTADENGEEKSIKPYTKKEVDDLIEKYNIKIKNKIMYDYVYVATMCRADFGGKVITTEKQLVLFIKCTVDDPDASDETTFRRWIATMVGNGEPIDWAEIC